MSKQITRRPKKQDRRQERREEQLRREAEQKQAARRRRFTLIGIIVAAVVLVGTITAYAIYSNGQPQTEAIVNSAYQPVDNIYCDQQEQTAFHIHAHLAIRLVKRSDNIAYYYWWCFTVAVWAWRSVTRSG